MASRFIIDMLMSRYGGRDGRNPYGSRGGYVTDRDPRRDRGQEMPYYGNPQYDMRNMPPYMNGNPYDGNRGYDYRNNGYNGNGYDGRGDMQYGKLSREDLENWKRKLENDDGTRGEHFKKEQLENVARQMNIDVQKYGGMDIFCMAVNMIYSDYCNVAKKYGVDRIDYYVDLAKAFFNDKDYSGNPEEKIWLYYKCIFSDE